MSRAVRTPPKPGPAVIGEDAWPWPLDLAAYDSGPELTPAERDALKGDIECLDRPRTRLEQFPAEIHRLLRPVQDVLDHTRADGHIRVNLFRVVAIQTHERQRSAWGWTHDEWVQTLNRQHSELVARNVTGDRWRADLVVLAYLLVGFCDWRALRRVERVRLATRVFGRDRLDAAPCFRSLTEA